MAEPFRTIRRVEFHETDMAGIVHFSNFFRYMEAAEHEFLRSRGLSVVLDWEGQRLTFPRVAASCDFRRPLRFVAAGQGKQEISEQGPAQLEHGGRHDVHQQLGQMQANQRFVDAIVQLQIELCRRRRNV